MTSTCRIILHAEAISWLLAQGTIAGASILTSLPDLSELPHLDYPEWRRWFEHAASIVMSAVPDEGVAIFYQSDIRYGGLWVDKGELVTRGVERAGGKMLFHRIVCRHPAGRLTSGRASYSHLLGFSHRPFKTSGVPRADVIADNGWVAGRKAMGVIACAEACKFILRETQTRIVVDPFCGWGTVPAVANALGMDGIGVDLSSRMCRRARMLDVSGRL